ncbi:unnamed protein product [Vicia faba]|uniref:Uncharacterized protein n=1 Tax=Vicia faba TaxID=3906 RepID=A0AAV0ZYC4_VICFA|nr:unnamed protein product [Vicia faba]
MDDNQYRMRLDKVSEHPSIHREIVRPLQSPIDSSSFDVEASTSRIQAFSTSSSQKRQLEVDKMNGIKLGDATQSFNQTRINGITQERITITKRRIQEIELRFSSLHFRRTMAQRRYMYEEFQNLCEIDEVITSPKRNIRGGCYSFVRFFDDTDEDILEVKLDNIISGSRKIFVNVL